jgi:citrate synthase
MATQSRMDAVEIDTARKLGAGTVSGGNNGGGQDAGGTTKAPVYEGLEGIVVAGTEICDVDGERGTLSYRGYDIGELACHATFEETVYLLWYGELPTRDALGDFAAALAAEREIDDVLWEIITKLPTTLDPMDGLRTIVSALASCDPMREACREAHLQQALSLVAKFPTIVANLYRHRHGMERARPNPELSHAANFLYMVRDTVPTPTEASAMDLAMLLMAEHSFNASTFAARVTAATLADMIAAITTAIGTLKGPLHGGANRRAMEMLMEIGEVSNVERYIDDALARKQRIMGFGHRVYRKEADPRSAYLRGRLYELCAATGDFHVYELATAIAETVEAKKGLYPNVDFYTAPVLTLAGVPLELFVTVFAISRIPGWTAHVMEQYANNRLIRPLAAYVGPEHRTYQPIGERG